MQPFNVTFDGPAVVPPVHRADVAVLALHRLERDRLVVSRPALFEQLSHAARVTRLSAPAGSGKTHLLRSWIGATGLANSAAWVSVGRDERDPQRFWPSLLNALRTTEAGASVIREMSALPDLDPDGLAEDLASLEHPIWLVIDDLQELHSEDALRQLELFLLRAPSRLRVVLSSRHEPRLGLHRLRLEGALTEIRSSDLPFTRNEARELLTSAGVEVSDSALGALLERTEGWAAGLRLAALSLAGHPDPERFAVEFSGSERTVADYLLAEVLDGQPAEVRRLLLRTSVLERVNGPLAERLTGEPGAERILYELEASGAFVVALDARRSWFRYHRLFAELLQLELRRSEPDAPPSLHRVAAEWFAEHGYPVDAVRHAQAAGDWSLAARLLSDHWFGLELGGQAAPRGSSSPRFRPVLSPTMWSSPRSAPPTTFGAVPFRSPSGAARWQAVRSHRCRRSAASALSCCSYACACSLPAPVVSCLWRSRKRSGCLGSPSLLLMHSASIPSGAR